MSPKVSVIYNFVVQRGAQSHDAINVSSDTYLYSAFCQYGGHSLHCRHTDRNPGCSDSSVRIRVSWFGIRLYLESTRNVLYLWLMCVDIIYLCILHFC